MIKKNGKHKSAKTNMVIVGIVFILMVTTVILATSVYYFTEGGSDVLSNSALWVGIFGAITTIIGLYLNARNKSKEIISKNYRTELDSCRKFDTPPGK